MKIYFLTCDEESYDKFDWLLLVLTGESRIAFVAFCSIFIMESGFPVSYDPSRFKEEFDEVRESEVPNIK